MPGRPINPIIWPLRGMNKADHPALQAALMPKRMFQPLFMQQRPRSTGRLLAPEVPVNYPWNVTSSRFGITDIKTDRLSSIPSVVHELRPYPPTYFRISGTTKDSTGAALGSCVVDWFNTSTDIKIDSVTSDVSGLFEFRTAGQPPNAYYLVAYKAGAPDVAGTSVNTLVGV